MFSSAGSQHAKGLRHTNTECSQELWVEEGTGWHLYARRKRNHVSLLRSSLHVLFAVRQIILNILYAARQTFTAVIVRMIFFRYGLLGASGCGKTTLLTCAVGRKKLDSGDIYVLGGRPGTVESGVPGKKVGYMPQVSF